MSKISIDRSKLADYFREHAQVLADQAHIELRTIKEEMMDGETHFYNSLDLELSEIPHEGLEVSDEQE